MDIRTLPPNLYGKYHYAALFISPRSQKWKTLKKLLLSKVEVLQNGNDTLALFKANKNDFETLYIVLQISTGWKSVVYFYSGNPISSKQVWYPVSCISKMKDWSGEKACCQCESINYDDMLYGKEYLRVFTVPCKVICNQWYKGRQGEDYLSQFMVSAQEWGITTCPFFSPNSFSGPHFKKNNSYFGIKVSFEQKKNKAHNLLQKAISFFKKT